MTVMSVKLTVGNYGQITSDTGEVITIKKFTWTNSNDVSVQLISYGGYITSIKLPDNKGNVDDIVLGFDDIDGYLSSMNSYFGATIGRCANRIKKGLITIDGVTYQLTLNDGDNHLHGGIKGFNKVVWDSAVKGTKVTLSYTSADKEQGYPGQVSVNVSFELTANNELRIDYNATTSAATVVNLTNHSYFNLAGHDKGAAEIYKHVVSINANKYTVIKSDGIPTGELPDVAGTVFDLNKPTVLGDVIDKVPGFPGFDHNFCVSQCPAGTSLVAKVSHPDSGRTIEVFSNQPGVQFYTGNFLPEDSSVIGKNSVSYKKHGAFCLETQLYPDTINNPSFGNAILYPDKSYHHLAIFKFTIAS